MIISEKQIMQLMNVANDLLKIEFVPQIYKDDVAALLSAIAAQQSVKLKEIK